MDRGNGNHFVTGGRITSYILVAFLFLSLIVSGTSSAQEYLPVAPGNFIMGSAEDPTESPAHDVELTQPFYMGEHEVTQQEWVDTMETEPWLDGAGNPRDVLVRVGPDLPAVHVSWEDVQAFIDVKNAEEDGYVYRLPTEAEWEYACRAGTDTRFYFGDNAGVLDEYAWYYQGQDSEPHDVGQLTPNGWGLYDMHGNVWEWCQDWYDDYTDESQIDPAGPEEGDGRVIRGGSFRNIADDCRSATRRLLPPSPGNSSTGFRLVRIPLDSDGDGVEDADEDYPNDDRKASLPAAVGSGKIIFDVTSTEGASLRDVRVLTASDPSLNMSGKPSDTVFPHGLVSFRIVGLARGEEATIDLTFPKTLPEDVQYYKVDGTGFYRYTDVTFSGKKVTLTLIDGEEGDMDNEDGVILDPGGPADPPAPPEGGGDGGGGGGGCFIGGLLE